MENLDRTTCSILVKLIARPAVHRSHGVDILPKRVLTETCIASNNKISFQTYRSTSASVRRCLATTFDVEVDDVNGRFLKPQIMICAGSIYDLCIMRYA